MIHCVRDNRGFTLIEVLACMGIITAGLVTILIIRNNNIQQTNDNACLNKAVEYASGKIEYLVIEYQQNGEFSQTSGWFDKDRQYGWQAENRKITVAETLEMMELNFTIKYPGQDGKSKFTVTRVVEMPNAR